MNLFKMLIEWLVIIEWSNTVIFEEIQILKHAYKSNAISAIKEIKSREHVLDEEDKFWNNLNYRMMSMMTTYNILYSNL